MFKRSNIEEDWLTKVLLVERVYFLFLRAVLKKVCRFMEVFSHTVNQLSNRSIVEIHRREEKNGENVNQLLQRQ